VAGTETARSGQLAGCSLLCITIALLPLCLRADPPATNAVQGQIEFKGCYASWGSAALTVGNTQFERKWAVQGKKLKAISFRTKDPNLEWLAASLIPKQAPRAALHVNTATGPFNPVEADSLQLEVIISDEFTNRAHLRIFPGASGVLIHSGGSEDPTCSSTDPSHSTQVGSIQQRRGGETLSGCSDDVEDLTLAPEHLRLTQVTFADQTDKHNELVFEHEWLLGPNEGPLQFPGNLIILEDTLASSGLAILKLAPLSNARPVETEVDFKVTARSRLVQVAPTDYPVVVLAYSGGRPGRIAALQSFQRQLRVPDVTRDGVFLSNTWGDRSRDARINEAFVLKEIEAGVKLGVDVVQIDDGWQKGRTKNSAGVKGVWGGWWAADSHFWNPDPQRFPSGLRPVAEAARAQGLRVGLWFSPDSSDEAANWRRDADRILELHRSAGIDYFKIDGLKTPTASTAVNQRRLFDHVMRESRGRVPARGTADSPAARSPGPGRTGPACS
jgi:alpha-galactosidase